MNEYLRGLSLCELMDIVLTRERVDGCKGWPDTLAEIREELRRREPTPMVQLEKRPT